MILDASALTDWLLSSVPSQAIATQMRKAGSLHTLDFAELEVMSAMRRLEFRKAIDDGRGIVALRDLAALSVRRHSARRLTRRIWELRHNHTPYDAAYVALAEALAMPLLTTDSHLARSKGHRAQIVEAGAIE